MKRTSFKTRISRKVRRTESPPPCWPTISHTLRRKKRSLKDEKTKPHRRGSRGRVKFREKRDGKQAETHLPMPPVNWTPSRLAKSRAPLECQKHSCKSVVAAAGAITAFAQAKKTESCLIGHWLYHLDAIRTLGLIAFCLSLSKMTIK